MQNRDLILILKISVSFLISFLFQDKSEPHWK